MKLGDFLTKRKYLIKLIITCIFFLLIPFMLLSYTLIYRSYNELVYNNEDFYLKTNEYFSNYFHKCLMDIRTHACTIEIESKKPDSPLKHSLLESSPYYFVDCIDFLSTFSKQIPHQMGLYYYELGFVFSGSSKYSLDKYMDLYSNKLNADDLRFMEDFFNYKDNTSIKFFSTFESNPDSGFLLVGIPVKVGPGNDKALIFYNLTSSSIDASLFTGASTMQFSIIDNSTSTLLYLTKPNNMVNIALLPKDMYDDEKFSGDKFISYFEKDGVPYSIYAINDAAFNYKYLTLMPFNQIETTLYRFYKKTKLIFVFSIVILVVLLGVMIYINYKPITKLVRSVNRNSPKGELELIESTLETMSMEMDEKNLLIMDLLLGNILYGSPIPSEEIHKLGITSHSGYFCVFVVTEVRLNTELRVSLSSLMMAKYNFPIYITDILGKNHTVIICLLSRSSVSGIKKYMEVWLSDKFKQKFDLFEGVVVKSINDIQDSYSSCLRIMKKGIEYGRFHSGLLPEESENTSAKNKDAEKYNESLEICTLKENILKYIKKNYTDPSLSQITVGDCFGISIYTLSRLFNNYIGIGFPEYINGKRIEYAKHLLLTSEKTINEISSIVGYNSPNYFSRLFKSIVGISPQKFRNREGETDSYLSANKL